MKVSLWIRETVGGKRTYRSKRRYTPYGTISACVVRGNRWDS